MSTQNLELFLGEARAAAEQAGRILVKYWENLEEVHHKTGNNDLVTVADKEGEEVILQHLNTHFPDHNILAEESGAKEKTSSPWTWMIDPLDGTTNYTHSYPYSVVSIGLCHQNEPVLGVVYNPFRKEMYYGAKGLGAFLNDDKIQVSEASSMKDALFGTESLFDVYPKTQQQYVDFIEFTHTTHGVRKTGAAALSLANVALGRLEGYWDLKLQPWDMAAAAAIITEAGGTVTCFDGSPFDPYNGKIIASNGRFHNELVEKLNAIYAEIAGE